MKRIIKAIQEGRISQSQAIRYKVLHQRLIGKNLFVEIGDTKEWKEFNELSKLIK
jgi:hypothetical protein|tara:strand:- start:167 stop:331 length:165 start_codon:yes stop_codon:yes gene_type:complete